MSNVNFIKIHDLPNDPNDPNGKSIKEVNLEKKHNIPLGALAEVKYDKWHGNGACSKVQARLWVVLQERDCDGTPLYWLNENPIEAMNEMAQDFFGKDFLNCSIVQRMTIGTLKGGFSEDCLQVIEITNEIIRGERSLQWDEEEK